MNPEDACSVCDCMDDGSYDCRSVCLKPPCGTDLYRNDTNYPTCGCKVCSNICQNINPPCGELTCPTLNHYYEPNECCPECRCWYEGVMVPRGRFGPACDNCRCKANMEVICDRPACPAVKLKCVDATFDKDCNYICPNGKTCSQGPHVIKYGEFKKIGNKVCMCVGSDWYPHAFCAKPMQLGDDFKKLMRRRCVDNPSTFPTWKEIAAL
ncbi:kielin/chordin-like protein [Ruditapes philippinarum]|uniref:kielin/chordin-like protein n=1 Tax=Ruditapes philippinarum TaxID=129788 RepID=UPI00295A65FC|nr:kielin/chordin-like protein [Ruditapes philippinarum]